MFWFLKERTIERSFHQPLSDKPCTHCNWTKVMNCVDLHSVVLSKINTCVSERKVVCRGWRKVETFMQWLEKSSVFTRAWGRSSQHWQGSVQRIIPIVYLVRSISSQEHLESHSVPLNHTGDAVLTVAMFWIKRRQPLGTPADVLSNNMKALAFGVSFALFHLQRYLRWIGTVLGRAKCANFWVKTYFLWHKQLENEIIWGGHHAPFFRKLWMENGDLLAFRRQFWQILERQIL